uniref:Uncharacterized protein n=1 Tax=Arundo donax TaxID=35708 RepID=A0A0A9EJI2_ARUDO
MGGLILGFAVGSGLGSRGGEAARLNGGPRRPEKASTAEEFGQKRGEGGAMGAVGVGSWCSKRGCMARSAPEEEITRGDGGHSLQCCTPRGTERHRREGQGEAEGKPGRVWPEGGGRLPMRRRAGERNEREGGIDRWGLQGLFWEYLLKRYKRVRKFKWAQKNMKRNPTNHEKCRERCEGLRKVIQGHSRYLIKEKEDRTFG